MNNEQVEKAFFPFRQFNKNVKYRNYGTGLGMPIVKRLIEIMGGSIEISSEIGKGTVVMIKLYFGKVSAENAEIFDFAQGTKKEFIECIEMLKNAAVQNNPSECERVLHMLQVTTYADTADFNLKPLITAVDDYDFDGLISLLDNVL